MKGKIILHLFLPSCISTTLLGQENLPAAASSTLMPISSECQTAVKLPLVKKGIYGPTVAPKGPGKMVEIKTKDKSNVYFFQEEHNVAWYYFDIQMDGELVFEIIPEKKGDDYDFILFKWQDTLCCQPREIINEIPIRSNLSRSGKGKAGKTGLSDHSMNEYAKAGPGETYSKPVYVRKKERYYLVLDNVYPKGAGHTIRLYYLKRAEISGMVTDDSNKPIKAEVAVEDFTGALVQKTESDPETGEFTLRPGLVEGNSYTVMFYNDSSFPETRLLVPDSLAKYGFRMSGMNVKLPRLVEGKTYLLPLVCFHEHTPNLLPRSYNTLDGLTRLMRQNKRLSIRIEGHANDPFGNVGEENCMKLSDSRTKTIYNLLLAAKIEKERLSRAGHGREEMLFPNAINQAEREANRRVEITVITVK